MFGIAIARANLETTALGLPSRSDCRLLEGLGVKSLHGAAQIFEPKMDESHEEELYKGRFGR